MKSFFSYSWFRIFTIFASLSFVLRTIFLVLEKKEISFSLWLFIKIYAVGLFFDILTLGYMAFMPLLYYSFVSNQFLYSKIHKKITKFLYFIFIYVVAFSAVAELVFWDEFQVRFNFIAVDYLIYTTEVIGNVIESYPIVAIMSAICAASFAIFCCSEKKILVEKTEDFFTKIRNFLIYSVAIILAFFVVDSSKITKISDNHYANEIASNGIYQLFSAFRNNQLDYDRLYQTIDQEVAFKTLRNLIQNQEPNSKFLNEEDISRVIVNHGSEKNYNIIFVSIESLSADFMKSFGNSNNLTPNLDELAKKGLFFTNLKSTGTRTVRGLEALTLSVPPTPGNSILRRVNNENLFNISSPLKNRGYDAKFIYGGFGYFDNMNYFFKNNGFEIVDREKFSKAEISFSNVWGVADEDLFDKTIAEADKSFAQNKPFLNFVMTTSNHRPFTYPEGKIDIPSKTNRDGAVKYTDYAIGKLLEKARSKKWFDNTIFVFVADHCAGSAGNTDVPMWRYQIPAIFYAPKIISPKVFSKNVSQIDIAPTLLGLLNLSYETKFFGTDVLKNEKYLDQHAFVGTYSDVGYFKDNKLYVLKPKKELEVFDVKLEKYGWQGSKEILVEDFNQKLVDEAISYYQGASYLFNNGKLRNFTSHQAN